MVSGSSIAGKKRERDQEDESEGPVGNPQKLHRQRRMLMARKSFLPRLRNQSGRYAYHIFSTRPTSRWSKPAVTRVGNSFSGSPLR